MHAIILILVGTIVGALARFIGPGRPPGPLLISMLLGVVGAFGGQSIGRLTGFSHGEQSADFLTALVGAVVLVALYRTAVTLRMTR